MTRKDRDKLILSLKQPPKTSSPVEAVYALMREAKGLELGEAGKFRAMDCHVAVMDIASEGDYMVNQCLATHIREDIETNQKRLGIA